MTYTIRAELLQHLSPVEQQIFAARVRQQMDDAVYTLSLLYGERHDFPAWVQRVLDIVTKAYAERPAALRLLDIERTQKPDWYQASHHVGYICYADLFAGNLGSMIAKIPYLQELGVTYLHIMPLLQPRPEPHDGGYAVMNYRAVDARLGTMNDLEALAAALREHGISLCIDLVCNHTAEEHEWAEQAKAGDPTYQDYFHVFPDRTLPDQYERTLREIFPETDPGSFRYYPDMPYRGKKGAWVWTTFHDYQWDLNYQNPAVFAEMLDIILFLANRGVEILRMDAVAFMWKQLGTDCENLPQAHAILQAMRTLTLMACPGMVFKAEAIVAPDLVVPYFGQGRMAGKECELAYHNSFMVLLWSMLAERRATLATYSLQKLPEMPRNASWVTYVRCHDDIGWAVTDENAAAVGLHGFWHRSFLSDFYSGVYPGSFARGALFQFNPETMDRRISGACASLCGLERALDENDARGVELAIRRILLIHSAILVYGGIPLLYMGDEIGLTNDQSYRRDPAKADDSRWLHRPAMNWQLAEDRHDRQSVAGRIFHGLRRLIAARKASVELHAEAAAIPVFTHNDHVFGLLRKSPRGRLLFLANITEESQVVSASRLVELGLTGAAVDVLSGQHLAGTREVHLLPYQSMWLRP